MTCRWVQKQLSAYLDDRLSGRDLATVWKHLRSCSSCQLQEKQLRRLVQLLRRLSPPQAPANFWAETHRRLSEQVQAPAPRFRSPGAPWRSLVLPALAAMLAALVLWNAWPFWAGGGRSPVEDSQHRAAQHAVSSVTQPLTDRARLVGGTSSQALPRRR